jgi:TPR repeat protein
MDHVVETKVLAMVGIVKRVLTAVVVAVMMAGAAAAGSLEDADAAYGRGDYATAFKLLRPVAEQGNALAQYDLGIMYANGWACLKEFQLQCS